MTAAHPKADLHELVDQLNPTQADAVRAVVVQLVTPPDVAETLPCRLPSIGMLAPNLTSSSGRRRSWTVADPTPEADRGPWSPSRRPALQVSWRLALAHRREARPR